MSAAENDESLQAGNSSVLFLFWWQWVLISLSLTATVLGLTFLLWRLVSHIRKIRKRNVVSGTSLQKVTISRLAEMARSYPQYGSPQNVEVSRPNTFGVYLGALDAPLTSAQAAMFSQWDMIVIDPFTKGVLNALTSFSSRLSDIGSREDHTIATAENEAQLDDSSSDLASTSISTLERCQVFAKVEVEDVTMHGATCDQLVLAMFQRILGILQPRGYTGVLNPAQIDGIFLSGWDAYLDRTSLHEITQLIANTGLRVFLHLPESLLDHRILESDSITGIIIYNATILSDGSVRDAFQLMDLRPAIKSFVSQACLRGFTVLFWDAYIDNVVPSNAAIKRGFNWATFVNASLWMGPASSQYECGRVAVEPPFGAFDWLKEQRVMEFHKSWSLNRNLSRTTALGSKSWLKVEKLFPIIRNVTLSQGLENATINIDDAAPPEQDPFIQESALKLIQANSKAMGCFPLGQEASSESFVQVVATQQHLHGRDLLEAVDNKTLKTIGQSLQSFCRSSTIRLVSQNNADWLSSVRKLGRHLSELPASGEESPNDPLRIKVYIGLDSGFRAPAGRFCAVYGRSRDSILDIYISRNCLKYLPGIVVHTYLSSEGFTREQCLRAEFAFSKWSDDNQEISQRVSEDIAMLSPSEAIRLLRAVSYPGIFEDSNLATKLILACKTQLLETPDHLQRKQQVTTGYLGGTVNLETLLKARVAWYGRGSRQYPSLDQSASIFYEIQAKLSEILSTRDEESLLQLTDVMEDILYPDQVEPLADLVAVSVFCYMRKEALDEVFYEVCDRNPLFNEQPDQAAAFAELFAVGSACEAYFDMTPSSLGQLLSDRYRKFHRLEAEPPVWKDDEAPTESIYAAAQIDIDLDSTYSKLSSVQSFGFLSVFALPALIDILLLTSLKRGLYLSVTMSDGEKHSATLALMMSLLLSGAIGSWITAGGSYYLISMAFSAMNMFVVTRLVGGFAFTLAVSLIGFMGIGIHDGINDAIIFFLYLMGLTAYLCLLATLANFQYPGSAFQSGRPLLIFIIPFLLISPIVTRFVRGHDSAIYLCVLYAFIAILLASVKYTSGRWATWFLEIPILADTDMMKWYIEAKTCGNQDVLKGIPYPKALKLAREALLEDVQRELKFKLPGKKGTQDQFVAKAAKSYKSNIFLLEWYCNSAGSQLPFPYSSTWNVQTKIALQTITQLQTGIRLHNAFIHWRRAGDEIGCSILYFIVALLDKWIALLSNEPGFGLGTGAPNVSIAVGASGVDEHPIDFSKAVGMSLAYYLIGAVLLDLNAQTLNKLTGQGQNVAINTMEEISSAVGRVTSARRKLYWKMLARYMAIHVWSLAVTSILLWVFGSQQEIITVYLAYVGAYTGLLWFQYTKIFSGPKTLKPLFAAAVLGLIVGFLLRRFNNGFVYNGMIALAVACWVAALLSLHSAGIHAKPIRDAYRSIEGSYHGHGLDIGKGWSQLELRDFYEKLGAVSGEERYRVQPSSTSGLEIKSLLAHALSAIRSGGTPRKVSDAFPDIGKLIEKTIFSFEKSHLVVECVSAQLDSLDPMIRGVNRHLNGHSRLLLRCEPRRDFRSLASRTLFSRLLACQMLRSIAENTTSYTQKESFLLETLLITAEHDWIITTVPVSLHYQEKSTGIFEALSTHMAEQFDIQYLEYLALGINADLHWDKCPRSLRDNLVKRLCDTKYCLSKEDYLWIATHTGLPVDEAPSFVARCDYGAAAMIGCQQFVRSARHKSLATKMSSLSMTSDNSSLESLPKPTGTWRDRFAIVETAFASVYHSFGSLFKFLLVGFVADPELPRELDCVLADKSWLYRNILMTFSTGTWIYAKLCQDLLLPLFLIRGRKSIALTWKHIGGSEVTIKRSVVTIGSSEGKLTGFIRHEEESPSALHPDADTDSFHQEEGSFELRLFAGHHQQEPSNFNGRRYINTYSKDMQLQSREECIGANTTRAFIYEYTDPAIGNSKRLSKVTNRRYPILRRCIEGDLMSQTVYYNAAGLVESGSYLKDGNLIRFRCHYRARSTFDDDLLRAEFSLPHMSATVSWAIPSKTTPEQLDTWIPHSQVTEATFVIGPDVYESKWRYDHKFDPIITTTLNGDPVETQPLIRYDHLGILKKPTKFSIHDDDPLITFRTIKASLLSYFGFQKRYVPVSTSQARSRLWKAWKNTPGFDGVTARWLDERLLRRDKLLKSYWYKRDRGDLKSAKEFLEKNADTIMASIDLDNSISGFSPLAMKISDLFSFGQGGDANSRTRLQELPDFDSDELQVLAADTGTWPNEGGGVSACRRDLINNLSNVKWHMIAESANDFGIPKHQTEENVQSLKLIPLWGLDFLTPTHGLFQNKLDSEVEHTPRYATKVDIKANFIPILATLVKGARTIDFCMDDIKQLTRALVDLNTYFQGSKHWGATWTSKSVKAAWMTLWTTPDLVTPTRSDDWFKTEIPTIAQLDLALELWFRYLFIFSIAVPEKVPPVFQASHHSVSASYGVVCKIKRNCTLQVWDHAISWRETNLYLSSALCNLPPFVRNALLGLIKVTSVLVLHHADNILPCADFFNPGWEIEIGSCQGKIESRKTFQRKIDPVVNGITDWNRFTPVKEITTKIPTVTMLSHVWFAKDIKTAILSADIIVNKWGFTDYKLDIYGALDKAPTYSTDCQEIIASKALTGNVTLRGEANPVQVLKQTWLFMNSSVSEGLPLALGEAALTGAPIVCTDVGATASVLTDPDDGSCYSAIVAPNDARALARAQIKLLGMLEEWSSYAGDDPSKPAPRLPEEPSATDIEKITARMYGKKEQRRALGMRSRDIVQKSFAGARYLREHEQMLWIGKGWKDMNRELNAQRASLLSIPTTRSTVTAPSPRLDTQQGLEVPSAVPSEHRMSQITAQLSAPTQIQSVFTAPRISFSDTGTSNIGTTPASTIYFPAVAEREQVRRSRIGDVNMIKISNGIEEKMEPARLLKHKAKLAVEGSRSVNA